VQREAVGKRTEFPHSVKAIKANGLVFLMTAVGDPDTYERFVASLEHGKGEPVDLGPDIETQTVNTLEQLAKVLQDAGTALDKVVKVNIFISDSNELERMNTAYSAWWWKHNISEFPARTTVATTIPWSRVQMDMIALQ